MAHSIEEPDYTVVESIENVEIRQYEPTVQAFTGLPDNNHTSEGFRRLAGFIFGGNDQGQKIAMTAPVQETLGGDTTEMAFTMPSGYNLEDLPSPDDTRVSFRDVPGRTVATVTFSGWATEKRVARYEQELRQALERNGFETAGTVSLNQYNPPWTLPFLRRNEIMVEVQGPS